jgi:glycosyltransferase involved in cell wall biosynthesis
MIWLARVALGSLVLFWFSALVRAIRAKQDERYRVTEDTPGPKPGASVGVVVPARNEVGNIGACVDAILRQDHADLRLVVLDDGSTDGTGKVLAGRAEDERLTVLTGGDDPLPEGWLGKAWACQRGSEALRASASPPQWLLFVDADVRLHPHAVAGAVGHASVHELAMVSGLGNLVMESFWEKVLQPVVAGLIMAGNDLEKVNDPEQRDDRPLANGQFILVRADAYEAVGGHGAVRSDVLDDVGMASAITGADYPYHLVFMRTLFDCRMYESLGQLWEGWTKNMFAGMRHSWRNLVLVCIFLGWIALMPFLLLGFGLATGHTEWALWGGGLVALIQAVRLWLDIQVGQDLRYGPTQVLGVIMTLVLLLHSGVRAARGTATWKGRVVPVAAPQDSEAGSDST